MNPHRELEVLDDGACPDADSAEGLPSPGQLAPQEEAPDTRVLVRDVDGIILGHAALWWNKTPTLDGRTVGAIGGFVADSATTADFLLNAACERLARAGCQRAIGPMNGNTWRRHRFVIESDGRSPYLMEPVNPPTYPEWWLSAGFEFLSSYSSSVVPLEENAPVHAALRKRLAASGVVIRPLDPKRFDDELGNIHAVSLRSFASNFLYTPLPEEEFLAAYRKVRPHTDPRFVLIAEKNGKPCGFVFAIPDLEAVARGETPALIVKTLAVDPEARCAGLGSLLVDEVHQAGHVAGYSEAIHALQHETNTSRKITGRHHGRIFRRYALFSKIL